MVNRIAAPAALLTLLNLLPSATLAQTVVSLQVAPQTVEVGVGERKSLLVTAYDSRGNVVPAARFSWTSTQPGVARVESTPATPNIGYVIGVSEGLARILVQVGAISEAVTVSVTRGCGIQGTGDAAQLQVVPNPVLLLLTEERVLEARFIRADGGPASCGRVSWRSLRAEVAAVDQQGHVIGITQGNGVIEANGGAGLVDRVVVQVTTDSFRFRRDMLSLSPAEDDTVVVVVPAQSFRPIANRELQWAVTPLDVALVSTNGVVTGLTEGSAELIARAFGKEARMPVVVHRPIRFLSVLPRADEGTVFIPLNGYVTFDVRMEDASRAVIEEARPSWMIEDPSVISIDQATARVTGRKMGTTRLHASARGATAEAVWNIEVVGPNVTIDRRRVGLGKGEGVSLRAAFVDDDGNRLADANDLKWTSLAPDVAIVDDRGNVTGVGFGGARIVAITDWGEADTIEVFVQGQLLVAGYNAEGVSDLYTLDLDSMMVVARITDDMATEVAARYSPDGTRIAYVSNAVDGIKILVMDADGSDQRRLTSAPDSIVEDSPEWTPDGSRIVYSSGGSIWIINVDGSDPRQLTSGGTRDDQPAVSPDGTVIAYRSAGRRGTDIYLMSIDGQQQRPLRETSELEMAPAWISDGQLAYLSLQGRRRNQIQVVMRVDLTTIAPTQLPPFLVSVQGYAISADGTTMAFTVQEQENRRPVRKLFIMPLTGAGAGIPVEVPRVAPVEQFFFPAFRR
ncbi:MAG: PD40 domain-containing protein [Gemmatimonadetes bacterium]|nr:PD40 domain-containing protein [Gemmatimonadota bacterium]